MCGFVIVCCVVGVYGDNFVVLMMLDCLFWGYCADLFMYLMVLYAGLVVVC